MHINHIAMYVDNLEKAKDFFIHYFGAYSNEGYHNVKNNFSSYLLTFADGAKLELMNKPQMLDLEKAPNRLGYAHISFSVGSKERVNTLTSQLCADGYILADGPRKTGDGFYESCIVGIENNLIEITI